MIKLLNQTKRAFKIFGAAFCIIVPGTFSVIFQLLPFPKQWKKRFAQWATHIGVLMILVVLNIKVKIVDHRSRSLEKKDLNHKGVLLVSNHLSYLDVLVISKAFKAMYITSNEVAESKIEGTICKAYGCLFIERRNRSKINQEIDSVARELELGHHAVLFAEATSTNGESVMPFKMSFFESAIRAETQVQPLVVQYQLLNGEPITKENRDTICYYGTMEFLSHFKKVLDQNEITVNLHVLPLIEANPGEDRSKIRDRAYESIASVYEPIY